MNSEATASVLLVEDDRDLAASVSEYLTLGGVNCDHAYNGDSGYQLAKLNYYDVILLDLMLPKLAGLSVCNKLRTEGIDTPILMLTAKDTLLDKEAGFESGTDDYLVKPFALKELLLRVRALAKRRSSQTKKLTVGDLEFDLQHQAVFRAGEKLTLTPLNMKLLELLMRRSPQVVSRREIEEFMWPNDVPESNNLKVQLYQLRQKVDKPYQVKLIETVVSHGIRLG
ncbi:response regulator transcription factor [Ferrimonas aestuarii]|uniref:Response regulator transcription factor n=1 Tax=Ferrimonas aestuarii TaxID=2569539 RepID=A0A4U1BHZ8_9GAMM|nr:response regulator transcription factor [Ferrimonas aestuarii]TKB49679.1 response regulator transcription factor [Ferrimonas aestuarii]